MELVSHTSEHVSSIITIMDTKASRPEYAAFGAWLLSQIRSRGMNQTQFAERLGVKHGTVSRWVNGRRPDGDMIERIADVLVMDYDDVATRAGYRPRELSLDVDPDSPEGQLVPIIRRIAWTDRDVAIVKGQLESMAERFPKREGGDE